MIGIDGVIGVDGFGGVDAGGKEIEGVPCVDETRLTNLAVLTVLLGVTALTSGAAAFVAPPVLVVPLLAG